MPVLAGRLVMLLLVKLSFKSWRAVDFGRAVIAASYAKTHSQEVACEQLKEMRQNRAGVKDALEYAFMYSMHLISSELSNR